MADIIQGRNPVIEALRTGRPINKIVFARGIQPGPAVSEILNLAKSRHIPIEYVERQALDKITPGSIHQGIVAYASAKEYASLDDLLEISRGKNEPPLYCVLDGIEDPQNLGAILRTADAAGIHGVVVRSRRAVGLTATVAKTSAGAIEYVPVARVANIAQTLVELKKNNVWTVGIEQNGKIAYNKIDFTLPTALVIGSEGKGLSDLVKKRCDSLAYIPMQGKISSLNASIAAALVMYEAFRQRSPDFL